MTPEDRKQLEEILTTTFDEDDQMEFARTDLEFPEVKFRKVVDFNKSLQSVSKQFVDVAIKYGRERDLVGKLLLARPNVSALVQLAARFGVVPGGPAADSNRVRYAAGQFNGAFAGCRRLLDRLQMLKELHDVLHQLQRSHGVLMKLATDARQSGYDPLDAGNILDMLNTWLALTDSNDRRRGWVTGFVRAVQAVAGCLSGKPVVGADVDRELELLRKLPADEQANLNERLVQTAADLDTEGLTEPLDSLLNALAPSDRNEFAARYDEFRANSDTLHRMIERHNLCQEADEAISQATVLVTSATGVPPDWAAVRSPLCRLLDADQPDTPVGRLVRMVDRLAVGVNASRVVEWTKSLRTAFEVYFYEVDAALLDATDRVLRTADVLNFRLRGYAK